MNAATGSIAFLLYLICTLILVFRIQEKPAFAAKPMALLLAPGFLAVAIHFINLYNNIVTTFGLEFGFFNAASAIGAVNSLIILLMSLKRQTELLATIVLPITAFAMMLEMFFQTSHLVLLEKIGIYYTL